MKRHWLQWLISGGCIALGVLAVLQAQRNLPRTAAAFAPGWKGTEVLPRQAVPTGDPSPATQPSMVLHTNPPAAVPVTLVSDGAPAGRPPAVTGGAFVHRFEEVSARPTADREPAVSAGGAASAFPPNGTASAFPPDGTASAFPPADSATAVQVLFEETVDAGLPVAPPPTAPGTGMPPRLGGTVLAQAPTLVPAAGPGNAPPTETPEIIWNEPAGPAPGARPRAASPGGETRGTPAPAPRTLDADPFAQPTPAAGSPTMGRRDRAYPAPREPGFPSAGPAQPGFPSARAGEEAAPGASGGTPVEGSGLPGDKRLEGRQAPRLTLEKRSAAEQQVGRPMLIELVVRNEGELPATRVEVRDEVPRGTQLHATHPQAVAEPRGQLVWKLGTIPPRGEVVVKMQVVPLAEGEIGSTATVTFQAQATFRATATRPRLVVAATAPATALIDEEFPLKLKISNQGTGVAKGVVVRDMIPVALRHPAGEELENELGDLAPGESRELELIVKAVQPGKTLNQAIAYGEGELRSETAKSEIEILAPVVNMAVEGPKRRFLDRPATYQATVSNPGTAPARQLGLTLTLPTGMEFVKSDPPGRFDSQGNSVHWLMEELPPQRSGAVAITVLPRQAGSQNLVFEAVAERTKPVRFEQTTNVEGVAAVLFQIADAADPVEVGGETTYTIRIANQGSKPAANVRVVAEIPSNMKFLAAEGEIRHTVQGTSVVFEPIASLNPKAETQISLRVRCLGAGDLRFRCRMVTDDMEAPVTKEESTRVYADE